MTDFHEYKGNQFYSFNALNNLIPIDLNEIKSRLTPYVSYQGLQMAVSSDFETRDECDQIASAIASDLSSKYSEVFPNHTDPEDNESSRHYDELIAEISKGEVSKELTLYDIAYGYFFFKNFKTHTPHFIEGLFQIHPNANNKGITKHLIFTEYCSKPNLSGKKIQFQDTDQGMQLKFDHLLYSYDEFLIITKELGIPAAKRSISDPQDPTLQSSGQDLIELQARFDSLILENLKLTETIQDLKEDPKTISKQSQAIIALSKALIGEFSSSNQGTIDAIKCELEKKVPDFHISDNSWRAYLGFTSKNKKISKQKNKIS